MILDPGQAVNFDAKTVVEVRETMQGEVVVFYKENRCDGVKSKSQRVQKRKTTQKKVDSVSQRRPAASHPLRHPRNLTNKHIQHTTNRTRFQEAVYSEHNSYADGSW